MANVEVAAITSEVAQKIVKIELTNKELDELGEKKKIFVGGLKEYMSEKCLEEILVDDDEKKLLSARMSTTTKVTYDIEKLKKCLSKKQLQMILDKAYVVNEALLREFLKARPELKNELKKMISSVDAVSEQRLSVALTCGSITLDEIKDAYKVTETKTLTVRRKKR